MIADTSTPVVVVACPHHGGLGVTRSLGRLGIPVYVVDSNRWAPALHSRYCRGGFKWNLNTAPAEKSTDFLAGIARKAGRRCLLIPGTDSAAIFVSAHAAALEPWYILPAQNSALVPSLCSKTHMHGLARRFQIPTPTTFSLQTRAERLECLKKMDLPLMIKGIEVPLGSSNRRQTRKLIVRSRQQLLALYDLLGNATVRDLIAQEYIPGSEDTVWMFNGYFNARSECLAGFTGRKLRQCPPYTGVTSLGVCQPNDAVEQTAKGFLKAIGYRGIVDMDFRYDARDGQYKLLDVNPRIGSTFRLFVSKDGMDVARAAYLDLTGQPFAPAALWQGRKWIVEDFYLATTLRYYRDEILTFREWLKSLRGIQESAFWASDDQLPTLFMLRADLTELFERVKRCLRASVTWKHKHRGASMVSGCGEKNFCA
jgi:D-aspartate ligase